MDEKAASRLTSIMAGIIAALAIVFSILWVALVWTVYSFYNQPFLRSAPMIFLPAIIYLGFGMAGAYLIWKRRSRITGVAFLFLNGIWACVLVVRDLGTFKGVLFGLVGLLLFTGAYMLMFDREVKALFIKKNVIAKRERK